MAYDLLLADRIEQHFLENKVSYTLKKMFGGLCFMVDSKMCVGVEADRIMARLNPTQYEHYLSIKGAKPMDFTGRPMPGYVFIYADGFDLDEDLHYWLNEALAFNPLAKASKKKKKKKI